MYFIVLNCYLLRRYKRTETYWVTGLNKEEKSFKTDETLDIDTSYLHIKCRDEVSLKKVNHQVFLICTSLNGRRSKQLWQSNRVDPVANC